MDPPSSGSAIRPTVAAPKRRRKKDATDSSATRRAGINGSTATRARARQSRSEYFASAGIVVGMPSTDGEGSGYRRPSRATKAVRGVRVGIRRPASPSSSHSVSAAGFCTSIESAPASMVNPSIRSV